MPANTSQAQYPFDPAVAAADPQMALAGLDYQNQQKALEYRQELAKSLLQDSNQAMSSGVGARGMAYRVSPLEGLARALSGGLGAWSMQQNIEDSQKLAKDYGNALIGRLNPGAGQTQGSPMQPGGGFVPGNNTSAGNTQAADITGRLETGSANPIQGLGSIAQDSGGSKSYGNFGLNSKQGSSAWQFRDNYGRGLGITADPGSQAFDAQWRNAASANPQGLRAAEVDWYNRNILARAAPDLASIGIPSGVANNPQVQAYFADRLDQQGPESIKNHAGRITQAFQASGGDPANFLRAMSQSDMDPRNWQNDFKSAIESGVYGEQGNTNRVNGRLQGALSIQPKQQPGAQSVPNPFAQGGQQPGQNMPTSPTTGRPVYYIPGMDDRQAYQLFISDRQAWGQVAARAFQPAELEKILAGSGLPPAQQQQILAASAREKSGLVQPGAGTQVSWGADGQPVKSNIPGATAAASQMEAATAAAKKAGEASGGYPAELNDRAHNATGMLRTISEMRNLNTNPGMFAGVKEDVGRFFRSVGVPDDTIQQYLKVSPGNLEATNKLTAQMAIEAVKQLGSRPTQMEFQRFLEANPNILQTPEGLKRVTQFMEGAANDTIAEQGAFLQAKRAGLKPEEYNDFPAIYNQQRAEAIRAGKFNSTPLQAAPAQIQPPAGSPPQQMQPPAQQFREGQTASGQNGQKIVFRNGAWGPL